MIDRSLWPFVIIVVLTAFLIVPNALYAFRRFLTDRNLLWLACYFIVLMGLGFLLVNITRRTMEIVEHAKEVLAEPGP